MEEKKERAVSGKPTVKAVAKKIITPNMQEWLPVSPKMPEKVQENEELTAEEFVEEELDFEEPIDQEFDSDESLEKELDFEKSVVEEPVSEEPVEEEPHSRVALSDNKSGLGMGWYVVHTYSGYENKVKANIEKAIENRHHN